MCIYICVCVCVCVCLLVHVRLYVCLNVCMLVIAAHLKCHICSPDMYNFGWHIWPILCRYTHPTTTHLLRSSFLVPGQSSCLISQHSKGSQIISYGLWTTIVPSFSSLPSLFRNPYNHFFGSSAFVIANNCMPNLLQSSLSNSILYIIFSHPPSAVSFIL